MVCIGERCRGEEKVIDTTVLTIIAFVMLCHIIGDFVLQVPVRIDGIPLAELKVNHTWAAIVHCLIYTAVYIPLLMITCHQMFFVAAGIIFATHLLEDRFKIPLSLYKKKIYEIEGEKRIWIPSLYIWPDNIWHIFCNIMGIVIAYNML